MNELFNSFMFAHSFVNVLTRGGSCCLGEGSCSNFAARNRQPLQTSGDVGRSKWAIWTAACFSHKRYYESNSHLRIAGAGSRGQRSGHIACCLVSSTFASCRNYSFWMMLHWRCGLDCRTYFRWRVCSSKECDVLASLLQALSKLKVWRQLISSGCHWASSRAHYHSLTC